VAAAKKNQRMQSKSATGGGSSTIESNPVMDSMLLEFHKFIQKWEPKFEKWDQMWDNNKEDRITVQEVPTPTRRKLKLLYAVGNWTLEGTTSMASRGPVPKSNPTATDY
jgi:transposase-like protein